VNAVDAASGSVPVFIELDGLRLGRALRAGIYQLLARQEHLNKINVFPVPDGDTGTNLAITMSSVLNCLVRQTEDHAGRTLTRVADAALDGARGNSGAILAQFFLGLGDAVGHLPTLSTQDFAEALRSGAAYARESLVDPREGTILTVLSDFAHEALRLASTHGTRDFLALLESAVTTARRSLEATQTQLESLRRAGVVDAGAQGFVEIVEGMWNYLLGGGESEPVTSAPAIVDESLEETAGEEQNLAHRYCTECMVIGPDVDRRRLREQLAGIGSSLVIAGARHKVKVHVHVNEPAEVFRIAGRYGDVTGEKADDMQRQQHSAHLHGRAAAIVTDSAADIPESEMERLDIHTVPVRVHFGERSFLDKVGISSAEFFEELARNPLHPKTSQPPPGDFRRQFEFLASHYPSVISINLTTRVSGTCGAARTAAERVQTHGRVTVIDSLNASIGQGLIVMYAAECAVAGYSAFQIEAATHRAIALTRTWGLVGSLDYAVRGGRVPAGAKRVADWLRLMPLLTNLPDGRIGLGGFLLGRNRLRDKFTRFVLKRLDRRRQYRIAVGHANAEHEGRQLLDTLIDELPQVHSSYLLPLGSALGVHGGPGMLVVGAQEYHAPASKPD